MPPIGAPCCSVGLRPTRRTFSALPKSREMAALGRRGLSTSAGISAAPGTSPVRSRSARPDLTAAYALESAGGRTALCGGALKWMPRSRQLAFAMTLADTASSSCPHRVRAPEWKTGRNEGFVEDVMAANLSSLPGDLGLQLRVRVPYVRSPPAAEKEDRKLFFAHGDTTLDRGSASTGSEPAPLRDE